MSGIWKLLFLFGLGFLLLGFAQTARADMLRFAEPLGVQDGVVGQWLLVVEGDQTRLLPATLTKNLDSMIIRAEAEVLPHALICGLVKLADGRVISTALHSPAETFVPRESVNLAKLKVSELKSSVETTRKKVLALEAKADALTKKLRQESGLAEVDAIYARISQIDREIAEYKNPGGL